MHNTEVAENIGSGNSLDVILKLSMTKNCPEHNNFTETPIGVVNKTRAAREQRPNSWTKSRQKSEEVSSLLTQPISTVQLLYSVHCKMEERRKT
jgi:hypothetical protein